MADTIRLNKYDALPFEPAEIDSYVLHVGPRGGLTVVVTYQGRQIVCDGQRAKELHLALHEQGVEYDLKM